MKIKLIILLQQMTAKEINLFDWMRETKKSLKEVLTKNFKWGKVLLEEAQEWEVRIEKLKWEKSQTLENFIKIFIENLVIEKLQ